MRNYKGLSGSLHYLLRGAELKRAQEKKFNLSEIGLMNVDKASPFPSMKMLRTVKNTFTDKLKKLLQNNGVKPLIQGYLSLKEVFLI